MAEDVVSLNEYKQEIKPKHERYKYRGHRYELVFDPKAPIDERWVWIVHYTMVYTYSGSKDTIHKASNAARRKIRELVGV